MTLRLRDVREPPLLQPPNETPLPPVTESDRTVMRERLEELRRRGDGVELARTLSYMRSIGVEAPLERGDRRLVEAALVEFRAGGVEEKVGFILEASGELGLGLTATADDAAMFKEALEDTRLTMQGKKPPKVKLKGAAAGWALMLDHARMRRFGCGEPVPADERRLMYESLEKERAAGSIAVGWVIQGMRELGIPALATQADIKAIRDELEEGRKHGNSSVLFGHYLLRKLAPESETERPPVPPLKRFR